MRQDLEIVRAGAGSGKTTDLCNAVAAAVADGLDPARILATTFTRKAAAELKGRIQTTLLANADGDAVAAQRNAERLELAAIGTVHSVAHQLIQRYAIALGLSPRLKVLIESGSHLALRDLLGMIEPGDWEDLSAVGERLSVTDFQKLLLAVLAAKRGNRIADDHFLAQMQASADRLCELLAPEGVFEHDSPAEYLYVLVEQALLDIESLTNDATKETQKARQTLRQLNSQRSPAWCSYVHATRLDHDLPTSTV